MSQTYSSNDFNDILDSLVLFMRNQDEFKDMNFDGSAIRELMRLLSFNAQNQAFQNNFVYNELQLDSAQLRQNVTSIASRLGYTPSSVTASKIKVNLTVKPADPANAPASLVLGRDAQFYATKDGQTFVFSPSIAYTATLVNGAYVFDTVTLLQGIWAINGFMVQDQYGFESYVIPNASVDTSTLEVAVRDSESSADQQIYSQFKTAYDLGAEAQLYFLRENRDGLFEFKFGDNKFAKKLSYGNVITARYLVTQGLVGNNVSNLSPVSSIGGFYDITLEQVDALSYGGADEEDIESIRTLAPVAFAASGNAVTGGDYVGIAKKLFPGLISDAISWGGEQNVPPRYGYVFMAVIPKDTSVLSSSQKDDIAYALGQYNVASITPIVVDPVYTYVNVDTTVKFNPDSLSISTSALQGKVDSYCRVFSKNKMEKFGGILEMSDLTDFINAIDPSIKGNYTKVSYEKRFVPTLNIATSYVFDFGHKIEPSSLLVTGFSITDIDSEGFTFHVVDDGQGALNLIKHGDSGDSLISDDMGTVNYETGVVQLNGFKPNAIFGDYVTIDVNGPATEDQSLIGIRNSILKFNTINVTTTAVK